MSDCITEFFAAWQLEDADARLSKISGSVTESIRYDDPRTPETLNGIAALSQYVGTFSESAPGWSAKLVKTDMVGGVTRVTVAFGGKGPDGSEQVQHGQYFVEKDADLISRMVGFAGVGEPPEK